MNRFCKLFLVAVLMLSASWTAEAFAPFLVKKIQIEGNQRISRETILNYLPFASGETLTDARSSDILRKLYETNFFDNVTLGHTQDSLVIKVVERPTIGAVTSPAISLFKQINSKKH